MNITTRKSVALVLALAMFLTMSCGIVNTLIGGSAGTTDALWSDVPAFPGSTKANLDLPLAMKLIVQAAFQGKIEFIAFTTPKTPAEIQAFYSKESMKSKGWTSDTNGCSISNSSGSGTPRSTSSGTLCLFGKKDGGKNYGLAIIAAQDDKTKATQIFFVRIDLTTTPTPKP